MPSGNDESPAGHPREEMLFNRHKKSVLGRIARALIVVVLIPFILGSAAWATLAVNYSNLPDARIRLAAAIVFVALVFVIFAFVRPWKLALLVYVIAFAAVLAWYYLIPASNDRQWQADVVIAPTIDINGDRITIHGVRNCAHRSETDYDVHFEDRTYELSKLQTMDLIMSYWGPRDICHTILCFGFDDGQYLSCSIETRKEVGEGYSAVKGCFRIYELIYIFADERDLIGLRTNHRKEDVYLYHLPVTPQRAREVFMHYVQNANELAAKPRWYNAITDSCSMNIVYNTWAGDRQYSFRPKMLLNGWWDKQFHDMGRIGQGMTYEQMREASRINARAEAAGDSAADFSKQIRAGLPVFEPTP